MDGIHDMGGMHGFGPVKPEEDEPVFHHDWEKRVFGISLLAAESVGFCDDQLRRSIERVPPGDYLAMSYYELWLASMEAIFREKGVLEAGDVERRMEELKARGGDG